MLHVIPVPEFDMSNILPSVISMVLSWLRWVFLQMENIVIFRWTLDGSSGRMSLLDFYILIAITTIIIDILFVQFSAAPDDLSDN